MTKKKEKNDKNMPTEKSKLAADTIRYTLKRHLNVSASVEFILRMKYETKTVKTADFVSAIKKDYAHAYSCNPKQLRVKCRRKV